MEEDLAIAVMNLISMEEHFFFTAEKTKDPAYADLLQQARIVRVSLMERMFDRHEGETWCIAKHLLATTMRLIEVSTKLQREENAGLAQITADQAYALFNIFWALRLKLIKPPLQRNDAERAAPSAPWSVDDIMQKLVDCCKE